MTAPSRRTLIGIAALAAFIGTVLAANWLIQNVGGQDHVVPVGFGLYAPAGVFAAGFAFTFRDLVHETLGRAAVIAGIIVGALLSYVISPQFAAASGIAFLTSELADLAVYEPLRRRHLTAGIALSNTAGAIVDSILFLAIAFGNLEFLWGQVVGKSWITLATILVLTLMRSALRTRTAAT